MSTTDDRARLQEEIEATREELGETVAALAGKADIKGRASRRARELGQQASGTARQVAGKAQGAGAGAWQKLPAGVRGRVCGAVGAARSHPPFTAGAAAAVTGALLVVRGARRRRRPWR